MEKLKVMLQSKKILLLAICVVFLGLVLAFQHLKGSNVDSANILTKYQAAKIIFPNASKAQEDVVENLLRQQVRLIVSKPNFDQSLSVTKKYQSEIRKQAGQKKFPESLALGVALLENGGAESAVSSAGAAGIFQITAPTAKTLGLKVEEGEDERLEPEKNIAAGVSYLDQNLELFSDPGLAVWAHHAGTQNVAKALKIYLQSLGEADAYDFVEAINLGKLDRAKYVWRSYVTKENLNIHKLLSSPALGPFLAGLSDETELYPYKVTAASIIFETSENLGEAEFLEKVKLFNQGRILLSELLNPSFDSD